jgi:arginase
MDAPLFLVPTAAGCPGARELVSGPGTVAPLLDVGTLDFSWLAGERRTVQQVAAEVADTAARVAAAARAPIFIGGDHTVALGGVPGVARGLSERARKNRRGGAAAEAARAGNGPRPPLFLLWLDAHPDVNTEATSRTGNPHGMVLSGLLGEGPYAIEAPLPPERVVLAGVRTFDPGEITFLQEHPEIGLWDVECLRGDGWQAPLRDLLRRVSRESGKLYVSVDMDVFDPSVAPGVATPAPNGALAEPVLDLLRAIRAAGALAGADVTELYPPADNGRTAALAASVVEALGFAAPAAQSKQRSGSSSRPERAA